MKNANKYSKQDYIIFFYFKDEHYFICYFFGIAGKDSWESLGQQGDLPKGKQPWIFISRTDVEADIPIIWSHDAKSWLIGKGPDSGKDWRQKKRVAEDKTVWYLHWLSEHEFEQTPGDSEVQGSLVRCSAWDYKELDTI